MRRVAVIFTFLAAVIMYACSPASGTKSEEPLMELFNNSFQVPASGGFIDVKLYTNQEYHFDIIDSWISEVGTTSSNSIFTHKLKVEANTESEERSGTVTVCTDSQCIPVTIHQEPAQGGTAGGGDNGDNGDNGNNDGGSTDIDNGEWTSSEFVHRSLALRITADWCGNCPSMANSMETAKADLQDKLELVNLHESGGLTFNDTYTMRLPYNITGYPTCIVDGRAKAVNYSPSSYTINIIKNVVYETEYAYPVTTGIALSSSLDGSQLEVDLSLYIKKADEYKVTVLLLEDDIIAYQYGGGDNYEHDHVARLSLSECTGDAVTAESDNVVWTKKYVATVPSECNKNNLKLVVYVQKPYGSQTRLENVSYAEYYTGVNTYVDNCRVVKVGTEAALELAE